MNRAIKKLGLPGESVTSICARNRIFNFEAGYKFFVLMKMHDITINGNHEYFSNQIIELRAVHSYSTRFSLSDCLNFPLYSRTKCQNSFLYRAIKLWNEIPLALREAPSKKFKSQLRNFIITN